MALTKSERRTIELLATAALSDEEIARQLGLSVITIKNRLYVARKKLGVRNRIELARFWHTELFQIGLSA